MSKPRLRTTPDLSLNSPAHQQAMIEGHDHDLYSRNVIDEFKDVPTEEIKQRLKETAFPYAVCFENWTGNFNMSTGIRNANAFNATEIFYLGDKRIDRRGMMGVQNYSDIKWLSTIEEFAKLKEKYVVFGIDNIDGSVPLHSSRFPPASLFVFGSEGLGLTPQMQSICQSIVAIEQFGSVRSINCGCASAVILYEYVRQMKGWS